MRLRRELRNPWAVAPIVAVTVALMWASSAVALECPDVEFIRVGDKFVAMGWTMGQAEHEIEDFGGYRLWMREVWMNSDVDWDIDSGGQPWESFSLVREYVLDEEDPEAAGYWPFDEYWAQPIRSDSATIFNNAFPYEFLVTTFTASDPQAHNTACFVSTRTTGIVYPRVGTRADLSAVQCIPNPYRAAADWEYGGQRRVTFIGLPAEATIRIYTVAADHVRTLIHDGTDTGSDLKHWDLRNEAGDEVAPGVYMFQVEADGMESIASKVMIIK
jgi:hypothetical protein